MRLTESIRMADPQCIVWVVNWGRISDPNSIMDYEAEDVTRSAYEDGRVCETEEEAVALLKALQDWWKAHVKQPNSKAYRTTMYSWVTNEYQEAVFAASTSDECLTLSREMLAYCRKGVEVAEDDIVILKGRDHESYQS